MRYRTLPFSGALPAMLMLGALALAACSPQSAGSARPQPTPLSQPASKATAGAETQIPTPEVAGVTRAAPSPTVPVGEGATATVETAGPEATPARAASTPIPGTFPMVDFDSYTMRAGEPATLHGEGFSPNERIRVYLSGAGQNNLAEAQADALGRFDVPDLQLPGSGSGNRTIVVEGESSGLRVQRTVSTVAYSPWVKLDPYTLKPGDSVGFAGHDFAPGEQVKAFLDDDRQSPLAVVTANDRGEISDQVAFTARPEDVGKHRLTFVSQTSRSSPQAQFEVLGYTPVMSLTAYAGRPGALVAFDGSGFAPGETIHAYLEQGQSRTEVSTFQADYQGQFAGAGQFRIPAKVPPGKVVVTVESAQSKAALSQTFGIMKLDPWVGLSGYVGPPGSKVTIRVEGFGANETVDVFLNGNRDKAASGETDILGATEIGPIVVPGDRGQSATLQLKGEQSGATGTATFAIQ